MWWVLFKAQLKEGHLRISPANLILLSVAVIGVFCYGDICVWIIVQVKVQTTAAVHILSHGYAPYLSYIHSSLLTRRKWGIDFIRTMAAYMDQEAKMPYRVMNNACEETRNLCCDATNFWMKYIIKTTVINATLYQ